MFVYNKDKQMREVIHSMLTEVSYGHWARKYTL